MSTDLHFHILPGLDDGPVDLPVALDLARGAAATGTGVVVATPHVSRRSPDNDATRIAGALTQFRECLREEGIDLDVRRGAEVALTRAMDLPPEELVRLRLDGGEWLLVECPSRGDGDLAGMLLGLVDQGHRLLLAHPERIPAFRSDPELLAGLVGEDIRCQVTAGAFVGRCGPEARAFASWLLEAGLIHVIASDAHSLDRRPPGVLAELHAAGVPAALAQWLTSEVPDALLSGNEPTVAPACGRRRRRATRTRRLQRA